MKYPFDRWDWPGARFDPKGAHEPAMGGYRFEGSDFAMRYDLRWQFICWAPILWGEGQPNATWFGETDGLAKSRVAQLRQRALEQAREVAARLVALPSDRLDDILWDSPFMRPVPWDEDLPWTTSSVRSVMADLLTDRPVGAGRKAALLGRSYVRLYGQLPVNNGEIQRVEGVKLPRGLPDVRAAFKSTSA